MNKIFETYLSIPALATFSSYRFTQGVTPCLNQITGSNRPTNYSIIKAATLIHSLVTSTTIMYLILKINQPDIIKPENFIFKI